MLQHGNSREITEYRKEKKLEGLQRGSQSKTNGEEMALEAKGAGWVAEDLI